ncbi:MAG TPA: cyclic pyranopterin monophosphate synthase MoaC [Desulfobacteria bacterium]|nr:cyclic pyranopterin monophosphate synthase MoaC [Desulfobacteria bacterium]
MQRRRSAGMIDISQKGEVERVATASGRIQLRRSTIEKLQSGTTKKGNVLESAELAAILAVKKTPEVIPLCHQINIANVKVEFTVGEEDIKASVSVKSVGKTGVEMDALHGLAVALLTVWDMVKAEEKDETGNYPYTKIEEIVVDKKEKRSLNQSN